MTWSTRRSNGAIPVLRSQRPKNFARCTSMAAMYAQAGPDAKGIVAKVFEALGKDLAAETVKLA